VWCFLCGTDWIFKYYLDEIRLQRGKSWLMTVIKELSNFIISLPFILRENRAKVGHFRYLGCGWVIRSFSYINCRGYLASNMMKARLRKATWKRPRKVLSHHATEENHTYNSSKENGPSSLVSEVSVSAQLTLSSTLWSAGSSSDVSWHPWRHESRLFINTLISQMHHRYSHKF
jgi:ribosomal protein L20